MAVGLLSRIFRNSSAGFYDLQAKQAVLLREVTDTFHRFWLSRDASVQAGLLEDIRQQRIRSSQFVKQQKEDLSKNFLTPFDKEDILDLSIAMHAVADTIYGAAKRAVNHDIKVSEDYFARISDSYRSIVSALELTVKALSDHALIAGLNDKLQHITALMYGCEQQIDAALQVSVVPEESGIEVIKHTDLLYLLESVLERCGDVVKILETYVVKYQ